MTEFMENWFFSIISTDIIDRVDEPDLIIFGLVVLAVAVWSD